MTDAALPETKSELVESKIQALKFTIAQGCQVWSKKDNHYVPQPFYYAWEHKTFSSMADLRAALTAHNVALPPNADDAARKQVKSSVPFWIIGGLKSGGAVSRIPPAPVEPKAKAAHMRKYAPYARKTGGIGATNLLPFDLDQLPVTAYNRLIKSILKTFSAVAYETPSHTPEKPRLRILIATDTIIHPDSKRRACAALERDLMGLLGATPGAKPGEWLCDGAPVIFDRSVYTDNQMLYLPANNAGVYLFEGEPAEASSLLARELPPVELENSNGKKRVAPADRQDYIDAALPPDPFGEWLIESPYFHYMTGNKIFFEPPWSESYSCGSAGFAPSSVCYFWAGTNGYEQGHIVSHHEHDRGKKKGDWERELGYIAEQFEVIPDAPPMTEKKAVSKRQGMRSTFQKLPYVEVPDRGDKGRVMNTSRNLAAIMAAYGVTARFNTMSKEPEFNIPWLKVVASEHDNAAIVAIKDLAILHGHGGESVQAQVMAIAAQNAFNPFVTYVESRAWDGVDRFAELLKTAKPATAEDARLLPIYLRRWLISAIASQFAKNFRARGCLTFTGAQSMGKTAWLIRLFKDVPGAFMDGVTLDPKNKDVALEVIAHVAVELGELDATFRKADIAQLKAFMTKQQDNIRRPYAGLPSKYPRQMVFTASVNNAEFLADETGNDRFWVIALEALDYQHNINMQQLWAQVFTWYQAGEQWWLTPEETAVMRQNNQRFEQPDPIHELIACRFDPAAPRRDYVKTATEILLLLGQTPDKSKVTKVGIVLRKMGFNAVRSNGVTRFYLPQPWEDNSSYFPPDDLRVPN